MENSSLWQRLKSFALFNPFLNSLYIHVIFACLMFVCLLVSNDRLNDWANRGQFFVATHMTPEKVYGWSKLKNFSKKSVDIYDL